MEAYNPHHFTLGQRTSQSSISSKPIMSSYASLSNYNNDSQQQFNTYVPLRPPRVDEIPTTDYYTGAGRNERKPDYNNVGSITISNQTELF